MLVSHIKSLLFCALCLGLLDMQGQKETVRYNSLLWEISGNGMEKPSYLYGTMHVSQKLAFHLSDTFYEALESCDMVALELNPETWMDDLVNSELINDAYVYSSSLSLNSDFYKTAFRTRYPTRKNLAQSISEDDFLINSLLYRSGDYEMDFEEQTYLDLYIFQTGQRMGLDIFSLEDYEEVMELTMLAMEPHESDEEIDFSDLYDKFRTSEFTLYEKLEDSYRQGNLDMVDSLSKLLNPYHNFHQYMIVERNKNMASRMDSIMQNKSLFTGIGAAHLPGDEGVIELLRDVGYTVTSVDKGIGGKSKKFEDKYDDLYVQRPTNAQFTKDKFIQVDIPGTLYEMPSSGTKKEYMHPDMVNGTYYWVKRVKTYGKLQGLDEAFEIARLDSLLYESIPGDILTQNKIERFGYQGYDITNKTRKGDVQRHQILVTPLEILIFKMGGTGEHVLQHGSAFFNSIKLHNPDRTQWLPYSPDEGGFSVNFPAYRAEYRLVNPALSGGPGIEVMGIDQTENFFFLRKTVLNDHGYLEEDSFELDMLLEELVDGGNWEVVFEEKNSFLSKPGLRATLKREQVDLSYTLQLFVSGPSYYLLGCLADSKEVADDYFSSMVLEELRYDDEFVEITDSTLHYSTEANAERKNVGLMKKSMSFFSRYNIDKNPHEEEMKREYIRCATTGEEVLLQRRKFERYHSVKDLNTFWDSEIGFLRKNDPDNSEESGYDYYGDYANSDHLWINHEKQSRDQDVNILEVEISDSLSSRRIWRKYFQYSNYLYSIESTVDPRSGPTPFVQKVFDGFKLLTDSLEGGNIFEPKHLQYLEDIASEDSLLTEYTTEFAHYFHFDQSDYNQLLDLINRADELGLDYYQKLEFIRYMSHTGEKAISYYKDLFMSNMDTVVYQVEALKGLARIKTKKSYSVLKSLLLEHTPIPSERSDLRPVFRSLRDSVELSASMFPELLDLNIYDEYEEYNWELLAEIKRQGGIKDKAYSKHKKAIINLAHLELKRQSAREGEQEVRAYRYSDDEYYSSYDFGGSIDYSSTLTDFAVLAIPWYDKEERVRDLFDKLLTLNETMLVASVALLLDRHGHLGDPGIWVHLCEDSQNRTAIYNLLDHHNKLDYFPPVFLTQEAAAASSVWKRSRADVADENVLFVDKKVLQSRNATGTYYFYKVKESSYYDEGDQWSLYYSGPHPLDDSKYDWNPQTVADTGKIDDVDDLESIEERIQELLEEIEMTGRSRYRSDGADGSVFSIGYDDF